MDTRPRARALLLPRVSARAARPRLAEPGAARGDARRAALLARPRRRRLPRRRAPPGRQGPGVARQPAQPRLPPGSAGVRHAAAGPQRRPRRPARRAGDRRDDHGGGRRHGRRALPAPRAARALLRRGRARAVEHAPDLDALGAARGRGADRGLRGGDARGRVAELGARQPRPLAGGVAGRGRAGARGSGAAVHARGTPTLYYGDELGLPDVPIPPERVQDPWEEAGRDPARTPMQWTGDGGFTTGEPWLPMGDLASTSRPSARTRGRCCSSTAT